MPRRQRLLALVAALLLTATLVSCGSSTDKADKEDADEPTLTQPEAGQCIAREVKDGNDTAPDLESVVPCTEPHVYEIIGTVEIPERFLDESSEKASLARRDELALPHEEETKLSRGLSDFVWPRCDRLLHSYSGATQLKVGGKAATRETLVPILGFGVTAWMTLTSPVLWKEGAREAVCSVRYEHDRSENPAVEPVASDSDQPLITQYFDRGSPTRIHACIQAEPYEMIPCNRAHMVEALFAINVDKVAGKAVLDKGHTDQGWSHEEFEQIKAICTAAYSSLDRKVTRPWRMVIWSDEEARDRGWVNCAIAKGDKLSKDNIKAGFRSL